MPRLFHLITEPDWAAAVRAGVLAPPSLVAEGFVHFSYAEQVAATAGRYYRGVERVVVVEFDAERIGAPVVAEDSHGTGELFPHIYAAIPTAAAVATWPLGQTADGEFEFAPGAASATGP